MSKTVEVNTCLECPHSEYRRGCISGQITLVNCNYSNIPKRRISISAPKKIPSWCPLVEYEDEMNEEKIIKALKKAEWANEDDIEYGPFCPSCGNDKAKGHSEECLTRQVLKELESFNK